jgi:HEPN domain-containing protein
VKWRNLNLILWVCCDAANGLPSESVDKEETERAVKIAETMINECEKVLEKNFN